MSLTFTVKAGKLPSIEQFIVDVCENTGWELIVCPVLLEKEDPTQETKWQKEEKYLFYLPFESARGIELWLSGDKVHLKLMPVSSHGDFALAREILRELMQLGGGGISSDDGSKARTVEKLNDVYDLDWFTDFTISGVQGLFSAIGDDPQAYVGLVGPSRYFYFGPTLATSMLEYSDDPLDIAERLFPMMSKVQYLVHYPEFDGYSECVQYELELPRLKGKTFAFLAPKEGALVPLTEFLGFEGRAEGEFALLPAKHFKTKLPELFDKDEIVWLDEFQFVLAPMKPKKYRSFVDNILPHCKTVLL